MKNEQEILDRNKIIAEFMGWKYYNHGVAPYVVDFLKNRIPLDQLKYHFDWSSIMEVYARCKRYLIEHFERPSEKEDFLFEDIREDLILGDIKGMHKHIYILILWFNKEKVKT